MPGIDRGLGSQNDNHNASDGRNIQIQKRQKKQKRTEEEREENEYKLGEIHAHP